MDTNYRNAREIFDYAAEVVRAQVPDADIPAGRPRDRASTRSTAPCADGGWAAVGDRARSRRCSTRSRAPSRSSPRARTPRRWPGCGELSDRVVVIDPMSTKGLEYDATVIVDPDEITAESPGGVRVLYVALTRAAHRMTVLRPA